MGENFYDILEVTEDERKLTGKEFSDMLNKKYKKLALKWHPDRWVSGTDEEKKMAEDKFKAISEAYDTLSDEGKRMQYDMMQNGGGNPENGDYDGGFDPFEMFKNMDPFFERRGGGHRMRRGDDTVVDISITMEESYNGCTKKVKYPSYEKCSHCDGTGSEDKKPTVCPYCNGTGFETVTQRKGNTIYQNMMPCRHCGGTGKYNPHPCKECNGTGYKETEMEMEVSIVKGAMDGMAMKAPGKGKPVEGGVNGDLYVRVNIIPDPYYEIFRDGVTLIHREKVSIGDALLGCTRDIRLLDGKKHRLTIPKLTHDLSQFRIQGKGLPDVNYPGAYGDLIVVVEYDYPKTLNKKQEKALKDLI